MGRGFLLYFLTGQAHDVRLQENWSYSKKEVATKDVKQHCFFTFGSGNGVWRGWGGSFGGFGCFFFARARVFWEMGGSGGHFGGSGGN